MGVISIQSNSESGVQGESVEELKKLFISYRKWRKN